MFARNTRCPDSKGIKTRTRTRIRVRNEIPDALIQKGLRRVCSSFFSSARVEIPDALIQKGLRPHLAVSLT